MLSVPPVSSSSLIVTCPSTPCSGPHSLEDHKAIRTGCEVEAGRLATALEKELAPSLASREAVDEGEGSQGRRYESTYLLMLTFPQAACLSHPGSPQTMGNSQLYRG